MWMPLEVYEFYLIKALFYYILSTNMSCKLLLLTKPYAYKVLRPLKATFSVVAPHYIMLRAVR